MFQEAVQLGAKWIKVSLGHFHLDRSNVLDLKEFLSLNHGIELLIENDQSVYGGNIRSMKAFFEKAAIHDVPVDMTFDAGNWFFSGQDVREALHELSTYLKYLHLKQVEEREEGLVTLSLDFEGNHRWINVMKCFPAELVKGLEFSIEPKEAVKKYIDSVTQLSVAR
ncbi:hypothetical protein [Priestia megaterium]|uniref:hypothetical protein n=1 Tax=Priestia megaterium TaxID=1404 RepID=UPI002D7E6F3D|nr:hypothetical protein [Priestia megaterium]MEB4887680.1 hypothetical protein [Priestia megaterium]